jgi:alpha-N-arabinofuranosidase
VNPGSDTHPLDVSAALSENRKTLTFSILNPSDSELHLELSVKGVKLSSQGHVWRMAPLLIDAKITVGEKSGVGVQEQSLTSVPDTITAPPFSVSICSFPCQ